MNTIDIVFITILMIVCFLAGFFLGMMYSEHEDDKRHRGWREYLKERYRYEKRARNDKQ
jgi:hypothetical protein